MSGERTRAELSALDCFAMDRSRPDYQQYMRVDPCKPAAKYGLFYSVSAKQLQHAADTMSDNTLKL